MNKKTQKGLVSALAAVMSAGLAAPVFASAATTDLGAQYKAAYDAVQAALKSNTQKDLTAARVLVDALYVDVKGTPDEYLATTLSSLLDPAQQVKLVELDKAIKTAQASVKQADINAARDLIIGMPSYWINSFSSAIDTIQQAFINKVTAAVETAEKSGLQADVDAANALVAELATVTNNDGVKATAATLKARVDKVVVKLTVESVSAINAKQVKVVFSRTLDATSAQTGTNYSIGAVGLAAFNNANFSPELQADGKTVIITLGAGDNLSSTDTNYVVTADNIVTADGTTMDDSYQGLVTLSDKTRPTFTASMSDANTLKLTFTEPVNLSAATAFADIKVYDDTNTVTGLTLSNYSVAADNTYVKINVSSLERGKAFTLKATGVADFAGNLITPNPTVANFTTVTDNVAPTIVNATPLNLSQMKVEFSEPIQDQGTGTGGYFTVTIDGTGYEVPVADVTTSDKKKFTVNMNAINSGDLTQGLHIIKISGYKDLAGNAGTSKTQTLNFVKAGPVITDTVGSVKNIGGTRYVVFPVDRAVTVTAGSTLALELTDSKGIVSTVTVKDAANANLRALDIDGDGVTDAVGINADDIDGTTLGAQALPVGTYTGKIGSIVQDTAATPNALSSTSVSFTVSSLSVAGNVLSVVQTVGSPSELTVTFDRDVDRTTALNPNNYTIDGVALASKAVFVGNTQTVKLTLVSGVIPSTNNYNVVINGVTDTNGVAIKKYAVATPLNENVNPTFTATLVSANKIHVKFAENVSTTFDATDDFVVKVNGVEVTSATPTATVAGVEFDITTTGNYLTNASDVITISTLTGATAISDALGNKAGAQTITVTH